MIEVFAEGVGADTTAMAKAEAAIPDGTEVELRIFVGSAPTSETLKELEYQLISQGAILRDKVTYDSGILVIRYVKQSPPATEAVGWIIPMLAITTVVATIITGIAAWQLTTNIGNALKSPIVIIAAVGALLLYIMLKPQNNAPQVNQGGQYE